VQATVYATALCGFLRFSTSELVFKGIYKCKRISFLVILGTYVDLSAHYRLLHSMHCCRGTLKTQDMKHQERKRRYQNSGVKTARNGNNGTVLQGVENARYEHSGKAEYRKSLIVKYRYTRTAAVGEC